MRTIVNRSPLLTLPIILGLILSACAAAAEPEAMVEHPAEAATMADEAMADETGMADDPAEAEPMADEAPMAAPAFFSVTLTDVTTGTAFSLGDFSGKVVLLEPFAQWCPTCLRQQREVVRLHERLGDREDLVSLGLDIDPNEDAAMLMEYLGQHGFDWLYAIAPAEVARQIGDLYGSQYLNPPSAPMLLIDRHGTVHPLPFGVKSADDLLELLEPFLAESM